MAIVFDKDLNEDRVNLAHNNNVIKFHTDNVLSAVSCDIVIASETIRLYPDPSGFFNYNFKEFISTILNAGENFSDTLSPNLGTSFVYDWTKKVLLFEDVVFTLLLSDDSTETETKSVYWLSGYVQLTNYKRLYPSMDLLIDKSTLLQRPLNDSYYNFFSKYWVGYPFDLTFLKIVDSDLDITNNTNSINFVFDAINKDVERLVFSDGRTDVSIEGDLPLVTGFNDLDVNGQFNILLEKITANCENGHYIKWINSFGGWSYWLFYKGNENLATKEIGFLFNDYNNLEDTTSPYVSLGKTSETSIQLSQDAITEADYTILKDLLDSVKIYLFTGTPFSQNTFNDWVEVNLKPGTFRTSNSRQKQYNLNLTIELPLNVTRTL